MERLTFFRVRLDEDAYRNFEEACLAEGLTVRAGLEAAVELVSLFCQDPVERQARVPHLPAGVLEEVVERGWQAACRIDRTRVPGGHRFAVDMRTEDDRVAKLRTCHRIQDEQLSVNSVIASVFTSWGDKGVGILGAHEKAVKDVLTALWAWAAQEARERDHERRRRRSTPILVTEVGAPYLG